MKTPLFPRIYLGLILLNPTIAKSQQLEVIGDGTSARQIIVKNEQVVNNAHAYFTAEVASDQFSTTPNFDARRSRGSFAMPLDVQEGDRVLALNAGQYIDGNYRYSTSIEMWTGPEPSATSYASYMTFSTTSPGEDGRMERMRINHLGRVGIASDDPASRLHVSDGDVYIDDIDSGVIMKSPDGNCWRFTPDNSGTLVGTSITCPN